MTIRLISRRHWILLLGSLGSLIVLLLLLKLPARIAGITSFIRGTAAYRAAAYGDAEIYFRQVPPEPARLGLLQYNLGNTLYQQGRYPEARACYNRVLGTSDVHLRAWAWANLGQLHYRNQRLANSYAAYCRALLLNPADEDIRRDFLFIRHQLSSRTRRLKPAPTPSAAAATPRQEQSPTKPSAPGAHSPQEGPAPTPASQLSSRDIQDIMGLINESENRVREKMNESRQHGRKAESDEKDY